MTKPLSLKQVLATLLTMAALFAGQNAWAQDNVTLSEDNDFEVGTAGHWYVNMPAHTTNHLYLSADSLTTCGYTFKVYDDGGKTGDYSKNCNGNLDITVPEGYAFLVTGTLCTQHNSDVFLRFAKNLIYYIGDRWSSDTDGEPKNVGPVTCDGNVMRIRFCSDNAQYAGFDLTVTVVDKNTDFVVSTSNPANGSLAVNSTAKLGETVTVTPTPDTDFATTEVSYTACSTKFVITPVNGVYSFTMPACDVSVDAVFMDDVMVLWGGVDANGSEEHPYVISNQEGWNLLITKTTGTEGVSYTNGKYFELATNISGVTQSVESFGGHLDGKGHKITLAMGLDGVGLINHIRSASSISNLTVEGSIVNPVSTVGGFVASASIYAITFTNCRSSVAITSSYTGNNPFYGGGFVGSASNKNVFDRCVFDGSFSSSNNLIFYPWVGNNGSYTVTNSAYLYNGEAGFRNGSTEARAYLLTPTEPAAAVRTGGTAIGNGAGTAHTDGFNYGGTDYYINGATVIFGIPGIIATAAQYNNGTDHNASINLDGTASFPMPATTATATVTGFAANYIDANGTLQTHAVSLLNSSDVAVTVAGGWYAVTGDVTLNKGLTFSGAAHLILTDGATLVINNHYTTNNNNRPETAVTATDLSVYGQALGTGTLNADCTNRQHIDLNQCTYAYGIQVTGDITFCGGYVNATVTGLSNSHHYGDIGCYAIQAGESVTITRGHISAIATKNYTGTPSNIYQIFASAVILDWHLPTDRIYLTTGSKGNCSPVSVAEGKTLWNGTEVISGGISWGQFNYMTLQPCIAREIEGYDTGNDKWAFIASPVTADDGILPTAVGNIFSAAEYDLYRFNQSANKEWENYKAHTEGFVLENGKGYLYATKDTQTLAFMGDAFNTGTEPVEVPLVYDNDAEFAGWNLVGNPFTENATLDRSYYVMNDGGTGIVATPVDGSTPIAPCTGVLVQATAASQSVTFTKVTTQQNASNNQSGLHITLSQVVEPVEIEDSTKLNPSAKVGPSTSSGTLTLDNAIVSFNEGSQLGKFYFGEQNGNIYIPQGGKDYAIACVSAGRDVARYVSTEVPINFKAKENGEYTITVNPEGVAFGYLHLIDNMTGADIDLFSVRDCGSSPAMTGSNNPTNPSLEAVIAGEDPQSPAPTYTFTAKTTDYESRFKLVFSTNGDGPSTGSGAFAFINNGNIIVNGEGTVQVVDVMGRIVYQGDAINRVSTGGMTAGVYVLRLINGEDVKTQKVVIR